MTDSSTEDSDWRTSVDKVHPPNTKLTRKKKKRRAGPVYVLPIKLDTIQEAYSNSHDSVEKMDAETLSSTYLVRASDDKRGSNTMEVMRERKQHRAKPQSERKKSRKESLKNKDAATDKTHGDSYEELQEVSTRRKSYRSDVHANSRPRATESGSEEEIKPHMSSTRKRSHESSRYTMNTESNKLRKMSRRKRSSHVHYDQHSDVKSVLDGLYDDITFLDIPPDEEVQRQIDSGSGQGHRPSFLVNRVYVQEGASFHPHPLSQHQWGAVGDVPKALMSEEVRYTAMDVSLRSQEIFTLVASLLEGVLAGFLLLLIVFGHYFSTGELHVFFDYFAFFVSPCSAYIQFSLIIVCVVIYDRADLFKLKLRSFSQMCSWESIPLVLALLYSLALLFTLIMGASEDLFHVYLTNSTLYDNMTQQVSDAIYLWNGLNYSRGICCILAWICSLRVVHGTFYKYLEYLKHHPWEYNPSLGEAPAI